MVKKFKKMAAETTAAAADTYSYAEPSTKTPGKKKAICKLTRKQLKRKEKKRAMGETLSDRAAVKSVKDRKKADRRIRAKSLW